MELLSPAGNVQKLYYAYAYGADAAYIGLKNFSLRVKADNFNNDEYEKVCELKKQFPEKKLHCALNIIFHDDEIASFKNQIDYFKLYPIDAFIVQDIGLVPLLQKEFPNAQLHLSTQASCVNSEAVKMYRSMGFSRIVLGREISLDEIKSIKDNVPDMELEAFAHGAMCIAYAGRCLMSAYLTGRSAQAGGCAHTCRWNFKVIDNSELRIKNGELPCKSDLNKQNGISTENNNCELSIHNSKLLAESGELLIEEHERPGEYFPVFEGDGFTAVMSSKDLRMIEHLVDMKKAGVDSLKIEGRMKSIYYVALVTQAYRKAIDAVEGKITSEDAAPFIAELENVAHRESTTGFYYDRKEADKTTSGASDSKYLLAGTVDDVVDKSVAAEIFMNGKATIDKRKADFEKLSPQAKAARLTEISNHPEKTPVAVTQNDGWSFYDFTPLNKIDVSQEIEFVVPGSGAVKASPGEWQLVNPEDGTLREWVCDGHKCVLYTKHSLSPATLVRVIDPDFKAGEIRDNGR